MVIKEFFTTRADGINLYLTYSDKGLKIKQIETGIIYENAVDVESANYIYEEVEEEIEEVEDIEVIDTEQTEELNN